MAVLTRRDFPRSVSAYALVVFLPFAAMLAAGYGAHAGLATHAPSSQAGLWGALVLSAAAVPAAGLAALAPFLGPRLRSANPFRRTATANWSIAP
jgi:hypothetical protein